MGSLSHNVLSGILMVDSGSLMSFLASLWLFDGFIDGSHPYTKPDLQKEYDLKLALE